MKQSIHQHAKARPTLKRVNRNPAPGAVDVGAGLPAIPCTSPRPAIAGKPAPTVANRRQGIADLRLMQRPAEMNCGRPAPGPNAGDCATPAFTKNPPLTPSPVIASKELDGQYKLVWSAVLDLENAANPDVRRRQAIAEWRLRASVDIDMETSVENLADEIAQKGIKPMDALHVASAIISGADWMLTTDRGLLRKMQTDTRIRVADPVDFIRQIEGGPDET